MLLHMVSTGTDTLPLDVSIHMRPAALHSHRHRFHRATLGTLPLSAPPKLELTDALKDGRSSAGTGTKTPLANSLIITQVAFSLVLLAGAGLFVRSLMNLNNVDTGFNRENVLILNPDPSSIGYKDDEPRLNALYRQMEQRVAAVHGVTAASVASFHLPRR